MKNYNTLKKIFKEELTTSRIQPEYELHLEEMNCINRYESTNYIGYELKHLQTHTTCKKCGDTITTLKDKKISYYNYDLIGDKSVLLKIHKPLFYCKKCACSTISTLDFLEKRNQKSKKLQQLITKELMIHKQTYSSVARRYHLSVSSVVRQFDLYEEPKIDATDIYALSIDEVRLIPNQYSPYQCVLSCATTGKIIKILENRHKDTVIDYFKHHLPQVKIVVQDFWETYRSVAHSIGASVCVDRFHFVRFVMWAYGRTRVSIQKNNALKLMKTWKLQNKSRTQLSKSAKIILDDKVLSQSKDLKNAYRAKEWYLHLTRLKDKQLFREGLKKWQSFVIRHELTEFYGIITTIENWKDELERMIDLPYSNGRAERINRDIKQAKNAAFGYRNLKRTSKLLRLRSLT